MTPTLRKLYHRRGKHLECIAEIDKKIAELTPEEGDLVAYDDGHDFFIAVVFSYSTILSTLGLTIGVNRNYLTILEKGFER